MSEKEKVKAEAEVKEKKDGSMTATEIEETQMGKEEMANVINYKSERNELSALRDVSDEGVGSTGGDQECSGGPCKRRSSI